MIADVVQPAGALAVGRRVVETGEHAGDDVVDVGEVAPHGAVVEHRDRFASEDLAGEDERRHVRPSPRPVDGKEPQPGQRQAVDVGIAVADRLHRLLGRGVERHRVVGAVLDGERQLGVGAVDR